MITDSALPVRNAAPFDRKQVPLAPLDAFRERIVKNTAEGARIVSLFASPYESTARLRLYAILSIPGSGGFLAMASDVGESYPALTPDCVQAHRFEQEIAEQWGVRPEGHPWLKPLRAYPSGNSLGENPQKMLLAGVRDFYRVEGEEVHEVAVGPVHAGIIEPGHFRFQCHGENVIHLEIALGYQHRGVERALIGGPAPRTLHYMETLAGDTTIGHTLAYCQAIEALSGISPSFRAQEIRGIALELERLANHTGDLGALSGDVGYLPTSAFCGRLRGDFLNISARACGSRFGRGWVRPGGSAVDLSPKRCEEMLKHLDATARDTHSAIGLLWESPSVMARFEDTGKLTEQDCASLGLVGVCARACGVKRDVRFEFPAGIYRFANIPLSTWSSGDVFARAQVRWREMGHSIAFIRERLSRLADGAVMEEPGQALRPDAMTVSLVEGWRGEICTP